MIKNLQNYGQVAFVIFAIIFVVVFFDIVIPVVVTLSILSGIITSLFFLSIMVTQKP